MIGQPIPPVRLRVYHATTTGNNFETLKSFLTEGACSDLASGLGQGQGFYVWSTKEAALAHFKDWIRGNISSKKYPLMIIIDALINPQEWDMDYECCSNLIVAFILGHWRLFKQIPDDAITDKYGDHLLVSKCKKGLLFRIGGRNIRLVFGNRQGGTIGTKSHDSGIVEAERLGKIFNYIQEHFPTETRQFEEAVFKKQTKKWFGLKYVGKTHLTITTFQISTDGRTFLSEEESGEIARINGVKV